MRTVWLPQWSIPQWRPKQREAWAPGKMEKAKQRKRGGEKRKLFSWRSTLEADCVILLQVQSKIVLFFFFFLSEFVKESGDPP